MGNCSTKLDFHLFADDTNLFFAAKNLKNLEITVNEELSKGNNWLVANKLTLNLDKSKFCCLPPTSRKLQLQLFVSTTNL